MKKSQNSSPALWLAALACTFFFAAGRAFIPHLGLQNDEALFGYAIYEPRAGLYMIELLKTRVPLMLMSYLGTLKGWIYRQIFRAVRPSISSIRVPMLLAGVAAVWLFYKLLDRISGKRAAVLGCALLATDSVFLLTICFDWGPVALQHLLLIGGMLLVLKYYQDRSDRSLYWGFFLFGLGMWDKALMIWLLSGIGVAALLTFPRQVMAAIRPRRTVLATLAFAVGALPLIIYNVDQNWATFRGNAAFTFDDVAGKARLLRTTASGSALFGWLVAEDHETPAPHAPSTMLQHASFAIAGAAGNPRNSLMVYAFAAALLLAPLARAGELRAILFALIAMMVAWGQMAVTRNAGGSVHHAILIWPFPHLVIAVSFSAAARRLERFARPALAAAALVLVVPNGLVLNQYYVQAIRNGGALNWNDAIVPLAVYMRDVRASNVFCVDWGILDSIRLLNRGRTPVRVGSDPVSKPELTAEDREHVLGWVKEPDHVFIAHTDRFEFFQGTNAHLLKVARELGFTPEMMRVIPDRFGRDVYEVYRFRPAAAEGQTVSALRR